jgi:hypothetical protein
MPDQGIVSADIPGAFILHLSPHERIGLERAACERQMSTEEWIGSLIAAHIGRRPTWNQQELDEIEAMTSQARQLITLIRDGSLPRDIAIPQLNVMFAMFTKRLNEMTDRQKRYWLAA